MMRKQHIPQYGDAVTRSRERGFSLIEMLLVATISLIVFAAITSRVVGIMGREAAFKESRQLNTRSSVFSNLMRTDADVAGYGLTRPRLPAVGTIQGENRVVPGIYGTSNGNLVKYSTGWSTMAESALQTRFIPYGLASFTFTPLAEWSGAAVMQSNGPNSWTTYAVIQLQLAYCNCVNMYDPSFNTYFPYQSGDAFQYNIEYNDLGQTVLRYYRVRSGAKTLLYTSTAPLPAYPITFAPFSYYQGPNNMPVVNMSMTGAPMVDMATKPEEFATLPTDNGTRLTSPVQVGAGGQSVLFLGGDSSTDVVNATADFEDFGTGGNLAVKTPIRGAFNVGDYGLLIDFVNGRSALYLILTNNLAAGGQLQVAAATAASPAFGRLYSPTTDYVSTAGNRIIFPKGSRFVKLAAPVEWTVSGEAVMRRVLGGPATIADLGVSNFLVRANPSATADSFTYEVVATLTSEGVESTATAGNRAPSPVTFTLSPPYLNQTYHQP